MFKARVKYIWVALALAAWPVADSSPLSAASVSCQGGMCRPAVVADGSHDMQRNQLSAHQQAVATANISADSALSVGSASSGHQLWFLLLIVIPALSVFGNILVIMAVRRERALQSATNYFIVSLAVADLLVSAAVMPFAVYVQVNGTWGLPVFVCDLYIATDVTSSTCSIFNLVAISVDRFIAITKPIKYAKHKNGNRVIVTIVLVWITSAALGVPLVLGLNVPSDGQPRDPQQCVFYNSDFIIYSSITSFYIPCCIMVYLYYKIFKAIRQRARQALAGRKPRSVNATNKAVVIENSAPHCAALSQPASHSACGAVRHSMSQHKPADSHNELQERSASSLPLEESRTPPPNSSDQDNNEDLPLECTEQEAEWTPQKQLTDCRIIANRSCVHVPLVVMSAPRKRHCSCDNSDSQSPDSQTELRQCGRPDDQGPEQELDDQEDQEDQDADDQDADDLDPEELGQDDQDPEDQNPEEENEQQHRTASVTVSFKRNCAEMSQQETCVMTTSTERANSKRKAHRLCSNKNLVKKKRQNRTADAIGGAKAPKKSQRSASKFGIYKTNKSVGNKREKLSAKRERKATKTLAIVLGVFLACWVPFFTCNVVDAVCMKLRSECSPGLMAFFFTTWIGYMNSAVNPVIYTIFNIEFRKAIKRLLGCTVR